MTTACSSPAVPAESRDISIGCRVILAGLVSRTELVGMAGIVLSFDEVTARYAIKVEATGESVKVLAKNLKPSIFMPGPGVA